MFILYYCDRWRHCHAAFPLQLSTFDGRVSVRKQVFLLLTAIQLSSSVGTRQVERECCIFYFKADIKGIRSSFDPKCQNQSQNRPNPSVNCVEIISVIIIIIRF